MAKQMGKYFIAVVPSGDIQDKATQLKLEVKDLFKSKYALKSPAHVTLKMPFIWNEAKEDKLREELSSFFKDKPPFELVFKGIGRFGRRVIFIRVSEEPELMSLQSELSLFCKKELKFKQELSDQAYLPHMTICFKDLKDQYFDDCYNYLKEKGFFEKMLVDDIALLKKENFKWKVIGTFQLKQNMR
ncbi:MAG TPA: 2'-5' RNA ligase family protein [Anditalea sp.]|nr:2'-5' RNA ligase family protein [Anditalea sp.]